MLTHILGGGAGAVQTNRNQGINKKHKKSGASTSKLRGKEGERLCCTLSG